MQEKNIKHITGTFRATLTLTPPLQQYSSDNTAYGLLLRRLLLNYNIPLRKVAFDALTFRKQERQ